jgi:hypothetical protein
MSLHLSPCSCLVLAHSFMESTESMLRKWRLIKIHLHSLRLHCNGVRTVSGKTISMRDGSHHLFKHDLPNTAWFFAAFSSVTSCTLWKTCSQRDLLALLRGERKRICVRFAHQNLVLTYPMCEWHLECDVCIWWVDGHVPCIQMKSNKSNKAGFYASRWKVLNPIKQAFYKFEAAVKGTVIMRLQFVLKNDQALTHYVGQGVRQAH